jgi:hypothetical protein
MVYNEKNLSPSSYLTGLTQRQITYVPAYPDITDNQWGIDTVSITFQVGKGDYDLSDGWQQERNSFGKLVSYKRFVEYQGVYITLTIYTTGWCVVNFNAARLVHADRFKLLDPDLLHQEIENLIIFLFPFVSSFRIWRKYKNPVDRHSDWFQQIRLSRLDVAINLRNVTKANLLDLEMARVPGQNIKIIYKKTKMTTTIEINTESQGKDHIYDKRYQLNLKPGPKVSERVHRFEAQLRDARLRRSISLAQINRLSVWELLKERWKEAGFRVVQVSKKLKDLILFEHPTIGKSIVNYIEMKAAGIEPSLSDPTERNYLKLIREAQEKIDANQSQKHVLELESLITKTKKTKKAPVNSDENSE